MFCDMRNSFLLLMLALCACTNHNDRSMTGTWIEQIPQGANYMQGFCLRDNGVAESVGMNTLLYHKWEIKNGQLILSGESIGNGQIILFADTIVITECNGDTLVGKRKNIDVVYVRKRDGTEPFNGRPSRDAHEGFVWRELSGAGLTLWTQENDNIRLIADPLLPGIVMVKEGATKPHMLIRIFNLPNHDIHDIIDTLEQGDNWDKRQTCKFEEVSSDREGVRRFVMLPDGAYATEIEKQMKSGPVPSSCNGWGMGNSGSRYFEIHDTHPDKALFVEIGQEAPLFDEKSIVFSDTPALRPDNELCKDELYTLKGSVIIGHEVRSFKPDESNDEYWIIDKTGTLNELYDKATQGEKCGKPVPAVLRVEYNGKWDDGFATEYSGVLLVREIISLHI